MKDSKIEDMLGKTIRSIKREGDEQIIFIMDNGDKYFMYHDQDCCESVRVEDIDGDLEDLIGKPLLMSESVSGEFGENLDGDDSFTWTYYKMATSRGYVTIRWYGSSNGYYSEDVSVYLLKEQS